MPVCEDEIHVSDNDNKNYWKCLFIKDKHLSIFFHKYLFKSALTICMTEKCLLKPTKKLN